jgi:hypothetical protein
MDRDRDTNPAAKEKKPYIHDQFNVVITHSLKFKTLLPYQMLNAFSAWNLMPIFKTGVFPLTSR